MQHSAKAVVDWQNEIILVYNGCRSCLMFLSYRYVCESICVCCYRTDKTVLVSTGFHGDVLTLTKLIEARLKVAKLLSFFLLLCPIQYATVVQTRTFLMEWIALSSVDCGFDSQSFH